MLHKTRSARLGCFGMRCRVSFDQLLLCPGVVAAAALDVRATVGAEQHLVAAVRTAPERRTRRQIWVRHAKKLYRESATGCAAWLVRSEVAAGSIDDKRATSQFKMRRAIASAAA